MKSRHHKINYSKNLLFVQVLYPYSVVVIIKVLTRHVNNQLTICIKENVFWFQVPIDDALAVQMLDGKRNFCQIEAEIPPEKVV